MQIAVFNPLDTLNRDLWCKKLAQHLLLLGDSTFLT